jgi:translation initiation factor 5B
MQSTLKASAKNKKDKKKAKKGGTETVSFEDGPPPGEGSDAETAVAKGDISAPKKPIEVTADDLADEEWGPVEGKAKKAKKGKGKKGNTQAESEDEHPGEPFTSMLVS